LITEVPEQSSTLHAAVLHEALSGLDKPAGQQKTLTPWLFYDERGSDLFEQITELPEYYPTRTERAIFMELAETLPLHLFEPVTIAELGAGTASKTGILLRAFAENRSGNQGNGLIYQPIDISPTALDQAATLAAEIPGLRVDPLVANYVTDAYSIHRPTEHRILALYIGSSIGNFSSVEATAILRNLRSRLRERDCLLLGVDLAPGPKKSITELIAAYDDAQGVTAAFNTNILFRLNGELAADFNLHGFAHRARWNAAESRMEMHLESLVPQTVHIHGRAIQFAQGETIHTENSYKFTDGSLCALLESAGFRIDFVSKDEHERFAVALAEAV